MGPASLSLSRRRAVIAVGVGVVLACAQWVWPGDHGRWAGIGLSLALAWAAMIDIDRRLLPDPITLGLVLAGLALAFPEGWPVLLDAAIGAGGGYASLALVSAGYRRWRGREGLGLGDAKLFAAAGAWMGWAALPFVLLAASLGALAYVAGSAAFGRRWSAQSALAFGPFLATGFWLVWLLDPMAGLAR